MPTDSLSIRSAGVTGSQLAAYARLLAEVFGDSPKFNPDALAWRYRDNPAGQVVGTDAWDGERLAAHYVTCPIESLVEGEVRRGLLSLNTATHPDYQGRGLFTRLAQATYEAAAAAGYDFVIGVANANSTPGFVRKLGFQQVTPLQAGVVTRRPRRFEARPLQYCAHWRPELLAWRLANPAGRYRVARHRGLTGVWAATHLPFVHCAAFVEEPASAREAPPWAASLFLGLDPRWLGPGALLPIPQRLRPSPLNLIWRPLGPAPARLEPDAAAISFLDFDPY